MRKVHHPKIVQRSDSRWMVVCEDCVRESGVPPHAGIGKPVDSFQEVERIWETHVERPTGQSGGDAEEQNLEGADGSQMIEGVNVAPPARTASGRRSYMA
jgi:hypothetical protein